MISQRYFQAAIGVMLFIGAFWGTLLLWQLSGVKEFTHMNLFEVNAHGQGQVYGWFGLVLMGACYWTIAIQYPTPFASMPLALILLGIGANMAGLYWMHSPMAAFAGGLCIIAAALIFSLQIYPGMSEKEKGAPPFLRTGLAFFLVSAFYSLWHHHKITTLDIEAQIFQQIANFQAPLRDLQVHGMALFLAAGLFSSSRSWTGFWFLLFGVVGESALFLTYRVTGQSLFAALLVLPWASLLVGVFLTRLTFPWAQRWLVLSLLMLLFLPFYSHLSHQTFSHAYYGAIRHAVTVGCFSQLALFLIQTQNEAKKYLFTVSIILLNIGCLLRVVLQILTDFHPIGFALIPLSGATEFLALATACQAFAFSPFKQIASLFKPASSKIR